MKNDKWYFVANEKSKYIEVARVGAEDDEGVEGYKGGRRRGGAGLGWGVEKLQCL
jgi:hypothetical protein